MSQDLRSALRDLAPEPPDELGRPHTARRRAAAIRRRRYAATATATVVVAGLLAAGTTLLPERRATDPTNPGPGSTGVFPDWPRRGDGTASDDRAAVAAYADSLPDGVRQYRPPRVLFSGGGVAVLHTVAHPGGERLVVLSRNGGKFGVYADQPLPRPGTTAITVALDRGPEHTRADRCPQDEASLMSTTEPARLLVLGHAGVRDVRWRAVPPVQCPYPGDASGWQDVRADGGAALVPILIPPRARVEMFQAGLPYQVDWPARAPDYSGIKRAGELLPVLGWPGGGDASRARQLELVLLDADDLAPYGGDCDPPVLFSLPDGTPVGLCVAGARGREPRVFLGAEGPDRQVRVYLDVLAQAPTSAFAAVVDGHAGRWLVVVGNATLAEAELVDGGRRRAIELHDGIGWLKLDAEPAEDARIWTPEFTPDGGFAIQDTTGTVLRDQG